jgi:restriction endonuclease S subunit
MKALQKHIYGLQKGGAQPHVYGKDLQNLLFPLPTIDKQSSFSRIAQQADKSGFDGFKSQFIEMFGRCDKMARVKDFCSVCSGKSIPTKLENIRGDIAYVKVADFNLPGNETYIYSSQRYVAKESAEFSKMFPAGSVIFAKNGAASLSNKKRLTRIDCCIDMNTMAITSISDELDNDFLFASIQSMDISAHVRQGAIPSISPRSIEDCMIPIPTKEEQCRYISIIHQADKS